MSARESGIHLTLFAKALAAFILIMAPIYILSVVLNLWGYNNMRKEQMASAQTGVKLYLSGLYSENFSYSMREQVKLVGDPDITLLASAQGSYTDVDYYNAGIAARKKLTDIQESSEFISEVAVYIPAKKAVLSTASGFSGMPADYGNLREIAKNGAYPFADYNGGIISCITTNTFLGSGDSDTFLIAVKFDKKKIALSLRSGETGGQMGRVALVSTGRGLTVMNETDPEIRECLAEFASQRGKEGADSGVDTVRAGGRSLIVTWAESSQLQSVLLFYTPEESFAAMLLDYRYWLIALSALIIASVFLFSTWIRRLIFKPLNRLAGAYRSLEKGDFNVELKYNRNDEFGFIYKRSNEMFRRLGTLIEQVYEQKIHAREAELKQLQYQINPHFLYNSIVIVGNLIRMTDYDVAAKLAHHLGSYYQYLTKAGDFVELEREASHARNYIEIQKIRFADRFSYEFDTVPEGWRSFIVPRLILQPIIENAFKYGLGDTVSGGKLHVGIEADGDAIRLVVEDNGGIGDGKIAELERATREGGLDGGTGLYNVHRRIQIRFGPESGLQFRRSALGGLAVEICIVRGEGESDAQPADR